MVRGRANPGDIDRLLLNTATQDSNRVRVGFGKDPGQAGKSQALHLVRALRIVIAVDPSGTEEGDETASKSWPFGNRLNTFSG